MSFFRCCVGADPRPSSESARPPPSTNRRTSPQQPDSADPSASKKKMKLPNEVFFDPTKPDGQLSSVTDPATSMRDLTDLKKRKEAKERPPVPRDPRKASAKLSNTPDEKNDMEAQDNNGLTRGQNFMKVEKWLRSSSMCQQVDITPGEITNIEDTPPELPDSSADPPSEKDRLPPALSSPSFPQVASR